MEVFNKNNNYFMQQPRWISKIILIKKKADTKECTVNDFIFTIFQNKVTLVSSEKQTQKVTVLGRWGGQKSKMTP